MRRIIARTNRNLRRTSGGHDMAVQCHHTITGVAQHEHWRVRKEAIRTSIHRPKRLHCTEVRWQWTMRSVTWKWHWHLVTKLHGVISKKLVMLAQPSFCPSGGVKPSGFSKLLYLNHQHERKRCIRAHRKHAESPLKINRLMLLRAIFAVCENHMNHTNTMCGENTRVR
jgi:hypothetical protein